MVSTIDPPLAAAEASPLVFCRRRRRLRFLANNKHRRSTTTTTTSYIRLCLTALLVLGTITQEFYCQPVTAFTTSSTAAFLGIYRHRIINTKKKNDNKTATIVRAASARNKNKNDFGTPQPTSKSGASSSSSIAVAAYFYSFLNCGRSWKQQVQRGYDRRVNADPSFFGKSITEVLVAAGTQLMAEWSRRGASRMIPELDFVVPAVLAAVFGKYYRYVYVFIYLRVLDNTVFIIFWFYDEVGNRNYLAHERLDRKRPTTTTRSMSNF